MFLCPIQSIVHPVYCMSNAIVEVFPGKEDLISCKTLVLISPNSPLSKTLRLPLASVLFLFSGPVNNGFLAFVSISSAISTCLRFLQRPWRCKFFRAPFLRTSDWTCLWFLCGIYGVFVIRSPLRPFSAVSWPRQKRESCIIEDYSRRIGRNKLCWFLVGLCGCSIGI